MTFADHVIIVTGASSGIGKALCLALAPERPKLVLAARSRQRLDGVAAECSALGAQTLVVPTDVTSQVQCRDLVARTVEHFQGVDVLVNNAGRAMWTRFDELEDLGVLEDLMRTNYLGSAYCTRYALPHLRESRGRLVAMSSVSGLTGVPLLSGYAASKHAVQGFFESLRIELSGSGVSVTLAAPDFVQSEIFERAAGSTGEPLNYVPLEPSDLASTSRVAARIVKAIRRRERLALFSERSKAVRWGKIVAPRLVDWLVARAIRAR